MFFPERIKGIKRNDRVLEIGPGATPFLRANVLLEKRYSSEAEYLRQCGGAESEGVDKRTVFYDGGKFPFEDKEFDYAICSHVLEHVDDIEAFCAEIFRVARAGYIEYPLYYYEYVYDIPEHVNLIKLVDGGLVYARKKDVLPEDSRVVRKFWFETLSNGYTETVSRLVPLLMEGFEWIEPFGVRKAINSEELCHNNIVSGEMLAHRRVDAAGYMEPGAKYQKIKVLACKLVSLAYKTISERGSKKRKNSESKALLQVSRLIAHTGTKCNTIHCIVFSMDRAMQLHALLGSYRDQVVNAPRLSVIYRVSSADHEKAYSTTFQEFSDLIEVAVRQDTRESFRGLVIDALKSTNAKNIVFLVDDDLFVEPVDMRAFASYATSYCVPTLRLGENLGRSYTEQRSQARPDLIEYQRATMAHGASPKDLLMWCWNGGELDWGYPLSVDGHILQRDEVIAMAEAIEFNSPNTFEGNLQLFNPVCQCRTGVCYRKSRLVNIPYNRVQTDFENIHDDIHQDYMLEKWNEGYRIDRHAYYGLVNESAHQEMPLKLIKAATQ